MPVEAIRDDLLQVKPSYDLIADCVAGETTIKDKGEKYLPHPGKTQDINDDRERYAAYKTRAQFYNVTKRTLQGLTGQVFEKDPETKVPPLLDIVVKDATGTGVTLKQKAKTLLSDTTAYGRTGILVDYPTTHGTATTRKDLREGRIRPTISTYDPRDIINWETATIGAVVKLVLVVLREKYDHRIDEFTIETREQFRVLRLTGGIYTQELFRPTDKDKMQGGGPITVTGADGLPLNEIPFMFVGSENNDPEIDPAPLYDMASINIAHYRNSADYEESVFVVGQPTIVVTGLTQSWLDDNLQGQIQFGSRGGIPLPTGADAKIIQAEPNTLAFGAMEHKERQMVALGAKLVEQKQVQRTATEANQESATETSTLADIANNVSSAIVWALEWCAIFTGERTARQDDSGDPSIIYKLNTDFSINRLTPGERAQLMKEWQMGAITWSEYRGALRKAKIAIVDDDIAKQEIAREQEEMMPSGDGDGNNEGDNGDFD